MGGSGSGRHWFSKKTTVEDCLTLNVEEFTSGDLLRPRTSTMYWTRRGEEIAYVSYSLRDIGGERGRPVYVLTLHSPMTQDVPLITTQLHSGGKRYWFSCPNCRRRVGRLHCPHGESYFFCRTCHHLTYKSCQESHQFDWLFSQIGVPPWLGRRLLNRNRRAKVRC